MTRISLTEDYDDRNVISKLKNMNNKLDSALADTQEAVSDAREAAGNSQTASDAARASAHSASESAEIVSGYATRLDTAEQNINDVRNYAEAIGDDVSAIDTEIHTTRPYADTNTEQTITAKKHIPTATADDSSDVWVNKAFVQATDGRNNLIHRIADEVINGLKEFVDGIKAYQSGWHVVYPDSVQVGDYVHFATYTGNFGHNAVMEFMGSSNNGTEYGLIGISNGGDTEPDRTAGVWYIRGAGNTTHHVVYNRDIYIAHKIGSAEWHLLAHRTQQYGNAVYHVINENYYGYDQPYENKIKYNEERPIVDITTYDHVYQVQDAIRGE